MNPMNSHVNKIHASIINAYKIGMTYGNSEKYQDVSAFEEKIQQLCDLEQGFLMEPSIISELPNVELEKLDGIYKEKLKETMKGDAKDSDRYRRFEKDIEDIRYSLVEHTNSQVQNSEPSRSMNLISGDDDMEIETTENDINFTDPLTKKLITNPVRNKDCNHIYDLNSITAALKNSRKLRCPYFGCPSRAYLVITNLIEDRELKRKIMQKQKDNQ